MPLPLPLSTALRHVREAPFIVDVLRNTLATAQRGPDATRLLQEAINGTDELTAVAAVHAMNDDEALTGLLTHPRAFVREHASWVLMTGSPRADAIELLIIAVAGGGFPGLLAQRTLSRWSGTAGPAIARALENRLASPGGTAARVRLVETLGLTGAVRTLGDLALDPAEALAVRLAAVAGLGDQAGSPAAAAVVAALTDAEGDLGAVARLAAFDLAPAPPARADGLTVAQLFLHADLDRGLARAGAGDNGGIATLLVRLGDALAAERGIGTVLTLSRGTPRAALEALRPATGHRLAAVPLLMPALSSAEAWPAWVAARRGIRRLLRVHGVGLLHLRMADVGSLAAADAATELGIPVVFTLAPDPHAAIDALDRSGGLTRENFGRADEREHYWFRARLVQRLAADAEHNVLFPRPRVRDDLERLLGLDVAAEPDRFSVVPEGIDLQISLDAETSAAPDLETLLDSLPADRRDLPLAVSVGRLHRVKGMATLVEAWAGDPSLWRRSNLLIIGGDLDHPSPDEQGQLDLIADVLRRHPQAAAGLLLPGHRPNDVVARWLAAARRGHGVYVCASLKEEFGLALLEALAAGLVVVGPDAGGPATYIENGVTGVLTATGNPAALAEACTAALGLAAGPDRQPRIDKARERIRDGFTIAAMATALGGVYATVTKENDSA
ncbi:MAG: glycosyltransferase [Actinoplanes sp.]